MRTHCLTENKTKKNPIPIWTHLSFSQRARAKSKKFFGRAHYSSLSALALSKLQSYPVPQSLHTHTYFFAHTYTRVYEWVNVWVISITSVVLLSIYLSCVKVQNVYLLWMYVYTKMFNGCPFSDAQLFIVVMCHFPLLKSLHANKTARKREKHSPWDMEDLSQMDKLLTIT